MISVCCSNPGFAHKHTLRHTMHKHTTIQPPSYARLSSWLTCIPVPKGGAGPWCSRLEQVLLHLSGKVQRRHARHCHNNAQQVRGPLATKSTTQPTLRHNLMPTQLNTTPNTQHTQPNKATHMQSVGAYPSSIHTPQSNHRTSLQVAILTTAHTATLTYTYKHTRSHPNQTHCQSCHPHNTCLGQCTSQHNTMQAHNYPDNS
jgi:radical SAM protein with 4Fe4S-binding SPASM domain